MKLFPGDILMYHYIKRLPPYIGIVVTAAEGGEAYVKWWSCEYERWDVSVTPHDTNDRHTEFLGVLPYWAETDERYGTKLPLTRRVAEG